ncbi:GNAT family acetyltransferase [Niabella ginsenosidivorans]|uniref:GNAT family acetyltransferase n=1 Tax=Niabella ginsenosidivorans TaxID=1176587 RepID=A0A1A9IBB3_9BACT|nr:GNAT family acetyltransferase [Niabella ginsenosidivorans]
MQWICKSFDELSTPELYSLLQLRSAVFVVEQNSIYQDVDGKDLKSYHLMGTDNGTVIAYTRLLPKGMSYADQSVGRVVVAPSYRAYGLGFELMQRSIRASYELFGNDTIRISAQLYLKQFYESLGFRPVSDVYDEDGIPHIEMVKIPG